MRKAAKVFVIIAMIVNAIIALVSFSTSVPMGLIVIAIALAVGIPALSRLSDDLVKPSIPISICTLLLLSPIAGILMLCIPNPVHAVMQCEKCGKRDILVKKYTVDTALGQMNRSYCPECKQLLGVSNEYRRPPEKGDTTPQCEKCGKRDLIVRYYSVNTVLGRMNRAFCPECKQIFDQEQQNKH